MIQITDNEFKELVNYMKNNYGINLEKKRQLIEGRMSNVILKAGMTSFAQYMNLVKSNSNNEVITLINKLTTNHTFFYREDNHYDYLKSIILPKIEKNSAVKKINIWSAGCSSGEEAYTTAMAIEEYFGFRKNIWETQIIATDISNNVLDKAKKANYSTESIKGLPRMWKLKYLDKISEEQYEVKEIIKNKVKFSVFNLMDNIPILYKNKFDVVFCRNVMIYFDQKTKNELINRLYEAVKPGGYIFIGHSESIQRELSKFKYICPAIYQKV